MTRTGELGHDTHRWPALGNQGVADGRPKEIHVD